MHRFLSRLLNPGQNQPQRACFAVGLNTEELAKFLALVLDPSVPAGLPLPS